MRLDPKEAAKMAHDNYQKFSEEIKYDMKVGNRPPLLTHEVARKINSDKWKANYSSINWKSKKKKEGSTNADTKKH